LGGQGRELSKRLNIWENIVVIERAGKIGSRLRRRAVEVFHRGRVAWDRWSGVRKWD